MMVTLYCFTLKNKWLAVYGRGLTIQLKFNSRTLIMSTI